MLIAPILGGASGDKHDYHRSVCIVCLDERGQGACFSRKFFNFITSGTASGSF